MQYLRKLFNRRAKSKNEPTISPDCEQNTVPDKMPSNTDILVEGGCSVALGVNAIVYPTGICSEPVSEELREFIKKDKLGQLLNNPIRCCVFYGKDNGYCYFSGDCKSKREISKELVDKYIADVKKSQQNEEG